MARKNHALFTALVMFVLLPVSGLSTPEAAGEITSQVVALEYVTPSELLESLPLTQTGTGGLFLKTSDRGVTVQFNYAINKIMLTGAAQDVEDARKMVEFLDVPSRQIVVEVKIVEVDNQKVLDAGIDWQRVLDRTYGGIAYRESDNWQHPGTGRESGSNQVTVSSSISAGELIKLVEDKKVGRIVNVPKIVTLNNKTASLLDGQRVTYVTKYSSYTNLYETQEMTSGLYLEVTPSIGSSGYLKLDVKAKLTALGQAIGGSPSESGQILDNTVIVRDGGSVLLGGFKTEEEIKSKHGIPLLGRILPFLFSRVVNEVRTRDVLIVLTPTIVDLEQTPVSDS